MVELCTWIPSMRELATNHQRVVCGYWYRESITDLKSHIWVHCFQDSIVRFCLFSMTDCSLNGQKYKHYICWYIFRQNVVKFSKVKLAYKFLTDSLYCINSYQTLLLLYWLISHLIKHENIHLFDIFQININSIEHFDHLRRMNIFTLHNQ